MFFIANKFQNTKSDELVNENIRFKEVRVIDQNGDNVGILSRNDALKMAREAETDLFCITPKAVPPVCRIGNYGKYRFEQQKKQKEMRKNQKVVSVKEIQLSPTIDVHDVETRLKRARKWLEDGDKVKIGVQFRGRQMAHQEIGQKVLDDFIAQLAEVSQIEKPAKMEGRNLFAIIAPKKK